MKITPGHSIGLFKIGDNLFQHTLFKNFTETKDGKFEFENIHVRVNKDGVIDLIATYNGEYNGIATGKTFRQVITAGHVLLYDEFDQVFYLKESDGLCIGKEYENLGFEELLDSKIQYLNIYDINANREFWQTLKKDFEEISKSNLADNISNQTIT